MKDHLSEFLPTPIASRRESQEGEPNGVGDGFYYFWQDVGDNSIGKVQQWNGNAGAVVRAWAFYRRYGRDLERMSEHAVLNSNYLRHKIMNPEPDVAAKINCMPSEGSEASLVMHEFTLSMSPVKEVNGVTGKDVAKRLLDYGYMSPTLYFPQIVPECLMIEPTETESKEVLDKFAADFHAVLSEDPEILTTAPHTTPVKRVDEVWAARNLILRHPGNERTSELYGISPPSVMEASLDRDWLLGEPGWWGIVDGRFPISCRGASPNGMGEHDPQCRKFRLVQATAATSGMAPIASSGMGTTFPSAFGDPIGHPRADSR